MALTAPKAVFRLGFAGGNREFSGFSKATRRFVRASGHAGNGGASRCENRTSVTVRQAGDVAQVEVEAALGKVVSLAGYRDLLGGGSSGARSGGSSGSGEKVVGNEVGGIEVSGAGELQPTAVA